MKIFTNVNRSGRDVGSNGDSFPYNPGSPLYPGVAMFMSAQGQLIDPEEVPGSITNTIVYALFCMPVPVSSVPTFAVTHVGAVLRMSSLQAATNATMPSASVLFTLLTKPGQGPVAAAFSNPMARIWNVSVPSMSGALSESICLRPAYDYFSEDDVAPSIRASWNVTLPSAGAYFSAATRSVPADGEPDPVKSDVYNIGVYEAQDLSIRGEACSPLQGVINAADEGAYNALFTVDFSSPVAAVSVEASVDHYWLAWFKPSGSMNVELRFSKYGYNEQPLTALTKARPIVMQLNDSVRFNQ